jgi:hypothetical protein
VFARKHVESPRKPGPHIPRADETIHRVDERVGARCSELADADVFRVADLVGEGFIDGSHKTALDVHFHFFRRVRLPVAAGAGEQRVFVSRIHEVDQHLRVEEHVAIEHDKPVGEQVPGQPQRVQAVGCGVARV